MHDHDLCVLHTHCETHDLPHMIYIFLFDKRKCSFRRLFHTQDQALLHCPRCLEITPQFPRKPDSRILIYRYWKPLSGVNIHFLRFRAAFSSCLRLAAISLLTSSIIWAVLASTWRCNSIKVLYTILCNIRSTGARTHL